MKTTRIAIIDDNRILTQAISAWLNQVKDFKVVGVGYDGRGALELVVSQKPDVLILELQLAGLSGGELLPIIKKAYPHLRVIVLTASQIKQTWQKVLALGADGIALTNVSFDLLVEGIRQATQGKMFIDPQIQQALSLNHSGVYLSLPDELAAELTRREQEILLLVLNDLTSKQIAEKLAISDRTVSKHRENIYQKLAVNSSNEIITRLEQKRH